MIAFLNQLFVLFGQALWPLVGAVMVPMLLSAVRLSDLLLERLMRSLAEKRDLKLRLRHTRRQVEYARLLRSPVQRQG